MKTRPPRGAPQRGPYAALGCLAKGTLCWELFNNRNRRRHAFFVAAALHVSDLAAGVGAQHAERDKGAHDVFESDLQVVHLGILKFGRGCCALNLEYIVRRQGRSGLTAN